LGERVAEAADFLHPSGTLHAARSAQCRISHRDRGPTLDRTLHARPARAAIDKSPASSVIPPFVFGRAPRY
jgi:hypothetical protein